MRGVSLKCLPVSVYTWSSASGESSHSLLCTHTCLVQLDRHLLWSSSHSLLDCFLKFENGSLIAQHFSRWLLEPFMWHTPTTFDGLFKVHLRCLQVNYLIINYIISEIIFRGNIISDFRNGIIWLGLRKERKRIYIFPRADDYY